MNLNDLNWDEGEILKYLRHLSEEQKLFVLGMLERFEPDRPPERAEPITYIFKYWRER